MRRLAPYLGIVATLIFGVAVISFFGNTATKRITTNNTFSTASSTPPTVSSSSRSSLLPASLPSEAGDAMTSAPVRATPILDKKTAPPVATSVSVPKSPTASEIAALDASAPALRAALVNIICYAPAGSGLHSISGSGVFIDPKGIILTNAHIAQYFLLADRGVSCTIRAGSPAADKYDAALVYISPAWLAANASVLTQNEPSGTGEYDFAFLAVEKSSTNVPLPSSFPFIPLAVSSPSRTTPVVIASYGAQFLATNQVQSALFPTIVFGSVKDVFTFASSTVDVLALGGSVAAQEGSSGGGVADASGALAGTITTSTTEGTTDARSLSAITSSYIRLEYAKETGRTLDALFAEPTATAIADFLPRIPALESVITAHLP